MSDDILDSTRKYFAEHDPDWDTRLLIIGLAAEVETARKRNSEVQLADARSANGELTMYLQESQDWSEALSWFIESQGLVVPKSWGDMYAAGFVHKGSKSPEVSS